MGRLAEAWRFYRDHVIFEEEIDAQPREEPEPLHPEPHPNHQPPHRLLLLLLHAHTSLLSSHYPNPNLDRRHGCSCPPDPEEKRVRVKGVTDTSKGGSELFIGEWVEFLLHVSSQFSL
jgi:hypothetical protein